MNAPGRTAPLFSIEDLHVTIDGKEIVKGVSLTLNAGEVHAIMGRNGSGKTTLSHALMGNPKYTITSGRVLLGGEDITHLEVDERAKRRLFLAFQYPTAIPGVSVANLLRASVKAVRPEEIPPKELRGRIKVEMARLGIDEAFATRSVNDGFSGGEKKRLEILQLAILEPRVAILDETDSGLDIDALKVVAEGVQKMRSPERTFLVITHYQRLLNHIRPDRVHVMMDGRIVRTGGPELALDLESRGYDWIAEEWAARA